MSRSLVIAAFLLLLGAASARAETPLLHPCDDPPGTQCGSIDVPLDRRHPGGEKTPIFFAVVPHRDPGPAKGTILVSEGGPGYSTTAAADGYAWLFEPLRDTRDLLLIDLRGTGRSAAIDCPDLQHGAGDWDAAKRACGQQLGASASLFGSADRAEDIEDVRAALGIPKLDYYGLSGGGLQVQAYAARHGDRLRTAVLYAPYRTGVDDAFQSPVASALVRSAVLTCERSPSCHAADRNPRRTLTRLLEHVRARPVGGVDETRVIDILEDVSAGSLNASEISAAARALEHGDRVPLLRMAAETRGPEFVDQGDPRFYADGDFLATWCTDGVFPWEKAAPEATRRSQYDAAVARLRPTAFAPFSVTAWQASDVSPARDCLAWPSPSPAPPAIPPGTRFPAVPALALSGDMDLNVPSEMVRAVAASFPRGQFVSVANTGHVTAFDSSCARELIVRFIETAARVDAGCASDFDPTYGLARFTRRARPAPRAVARAAWAAAYDAIQHSFRVGDSGTGLRGGSFTADNQWPVVDLEYDGVRFARNVAVSGTAHLDSGEIVADLEVDGPGAADGTLRVTGLLFPHTAPLTARGRIGGRPVSVLVPTA